MEKPPSISQPRSRWDKLDTGIMMVSLIAVGSGFLFLESFNEPREKVRSVLEGDRIPAGNVPDDIAPTDSTH